MEIKRVNRYAISSLLKPKSYQEANKTNPPREYKGWQFRNSSKEVDPNAKEEDDAGKWINEIFKNLARYKDKINDFLDLGYNPEQAKGILNESIKIAERSCDWAINTAKYCGIAAKSIALSMPFGIAKAIVNNLGINNPSIKYIVDMPHALFVSIRDFYQSLIYGGRDDDDRARNNYEAKVYGNKVSSIFGDISYHSLTKATWIRPILVFFSENIQKAIEPLITLPNLQWFRVRMGSEIDLRFPTNFLNYLIHKPLSLLGVKRSKEVIKEIKNDGNLRLDYIKTRNMENIGLDPNKEEDKTRSVTKQFFKETGNIFSKKKSYEEKGKSCFMAGKLLSPYLGLYSFLSLTIGTPIKSLLTYLGKQNKYLDSLCQSGVGMQHILYILKFVLKEQCENRKEICSLDDHEACKLKLERNKLFYTGLAAFSMNILSIPLKLFKGENKYFKMIHDIYDELSDRLVSLYFSWRRTLVGKKHKLDNPELYNQNDSAKIISDKLSLSELENKEQKEKPEEESEESEESKKEVVVKHLKSVVLGQ